MTDVGVSRKKFSLGNFTEDNSACQDTLGHSSSGSVCLAGSGPVHQGCLLRCGCGRNSSLAHQGRRNFAKHGLEADLVTVRSAPLQVSALVSNEVQFVRGSASSMLSAAAQGAKLKILMSLFAERASYDFLVAPSIAKPQDLKGRKIGVQDFSGLLGALPCCR